MNGWIFSPSPFKWAKSHHHQNTAEPGTASIMKTVLMPCTGIVCVLFSVLHSFVLFCWQKRIGRTPKTPRTLARIAAPTTGHADSPDTLVIGKKVFGAPGRTPKPKRKSQAVSWAATYRREWGGGGSIYSVCFRWTWHLRHSCQPFWISWDFSSFNLESDFLRSVIFHFY